MVLSIGYPKSLPKGISKLSWTAPGKREIFTPPLMTQRLRTSASESENSFVARVDPRSRYQINDKVRVFLNMENMHIFDKETEMAVR